MPDNVTGAKDMLGGGERLDCCNLESKHEMRGWQHSRAKNGESSQTGTPEISASACGSKQWTRPRDCVSHRCLGSVAKISRQIKYLPVPDSKSPKINKTHQA